MKKPHVTQLLDLLNKPALLNWANKIGLQGINIDEFRKNALRKGSARHREIENFLIDNIPFENSEDN